MTDADIRIDDRRGRLGFAMGIVLILVLVGVLLTLDADHRAALMGEDGPVEILSAAGYLVCALLMLRLGHLVGIAPFIVTLAAMGLRELDMDKRPFTEGLLKSRQYIGDTVGLAERLVALAILLVIIGAVVTLIRRHGRSLIAGLARGNGAAMCVAAAIGLVVVSKSIDGLGRKLEPLGVTISEELGMAAGTIEEALELGIPLMLATAILAMPGAASRTESPHDVGAR